MAVTKKEAKKIVMSVMSQYKGLLTREQVAEGIRLAQENAVRLLNAARLLLKTGDAPTAMSLSILALEEYGKIEIVNEIGNTSDPEKLEKCWKAYRTHISKEIAFLRDYAKMKGIVGKQEAAEFCENNSDMLPLVDLMKQLGFYTDCIQGDDNFYWHEPKKKISNIMAVAIFSAAEQAILGKIRPDMIIMGKIMGEMKGKK